MKISKILAVSAVGLILAGCKIEVIVPEGGMVVTESGTFECKAGETCPVSVVDIFFEEAYIAQPDEGMAFTGWKTRHRGFCGGSTEPCALHTSGFEGNDDLMPFLENDDEVFYLEATFGAGGEGYPTCDYVSNPVGSFLFDVCETGHDEGSCSGLDGTFNASGSCIDGRSPPPVGFCATDIGDTYYYDHDASVSSLSAGCRFAGGEWTEF